MATFTRTELKAEAKKVLSAQTGAFLLMALLYMVLSWVFSFMDARFSQDGRPILISLVVSILAIGVGGLLSIGFASASLKALVGEKVNAGNVFDGFENMGKNLGLTFLMAVKIFAWTLLFIVPGFIASYRYAMAWYIIVEHPELSASEAIRESSRMMDGHKWELFVLGLSFILWGLLTIVTLGIAGLWVYPYQQLTFAAFYNRIKGTSGSVAGYETIAGIDGATITPDEAREAIKAVMNSNAGAPVIEEEVVEISEEQADKSPAEAAVEVVVEAPSKTADETPKVDD